MRNQVGQELGDPERRDRLRLIRSENVGPITFRRLLDRFGTSECFVFQGRFDISEPRGSAVDTPSQFAVDTPRLPTRCSGLIQDVVGWTGLPLVASSHGRGRPARTLYSDRGRSAVAGQPGHDGVSLPLPSEEAYEAYYVLQGGRFPECSRSGGVWHCHNLGLGPNHLRCFASERRDRSGAAAETPNQVRAL
jgi:DprA-like N-terminal HHH domain